MHDKIRAAFGEIHAEEDLKAQTRAYLARQAPGHRRRISGRMRLVPALTCFLLGRVPHVFHPLRDHQH